MGKDAKQLTDHRYTGCRQVCERCRRAEQTVFHGHWSVGYAGGRLNARASLSVCLCDWERCLEPGGPGGCGLGALTQWGLLVNPKGQLPEGVCYQL